MPIISTFPIVNGGGSNNDLGYTKSAAIVEGDQPVLDPITQAAIDTLHAEVEATKKSVSDGKILVANAITEKGIATATDSTFATMAANIGSIDTLTTGTADATATASQILSGQTAYVKGSKVTGTMTNQGAKTSSLNAGGSYTIPAGYHNGSGKITANSLSSQTSATAAAADILSGKTAWVNGNKVTGTLTQGLKVATGTASVTSLTNGSTIVATGLNVTPKLVLCEFYGANVLCTTSYSSSQLPLITNTCSFWLTTTNTIINVNSGGSNYTYTLSISYTSGTIKLNATNSYSSSMVTTINSIDRLTWYVLYE